MLTLQVSFQHIYTDTINKDGTKADRLFVVQGGMGDELGMTSTDYSVSLLVFFISYVLFETPSNMILTRVRPSIYMPVSLCLLVYQNPSGH